MGRRKKTARSAEYKAKLVLAALLDDKTLQQLGRIYDVYPSLIDQWRKQLLLGAAGVFQSNDALPDTAAQQAREAKLYEQIGRLNMELDWLKKKLPASSEARRRLIEPGHAKMSIRRQCELLDLPRSTFYYQPASETDENLYLMRLIDEQYMRMPYYGSRRMAKAKGNESAPASTPGEERTNQRESLYFRGISGPEIGVHHTPHEKQIAKNSQSALSF